MLTATARNGVVYVSNGQTEVNVTTGVQAELDVAGTSLWWIDAGNLNSATLNPDMSLGTVTLISPARTFKLRDMGDKGTSVAYLHGPNLSILLETTTYTLEWPVARSDDFDFEFSTDLRTLSVIYRLPGSPLQAFVALYSYQNDTYIVVDALLRVFDFELGARTLDPKAANLTR